MYRKHYLYHNRKPDVSSSGTSRIISILVPVLAVLVLLATLGWLFSPSSVVTFYYLFLPLSSFFFWITEPVFFTTSIALVIWYVFCFRRHVASLLVSIVALVVLGHFLKDLTEITRPFIVLGLPPILPEVNNSFPSMHALLGGVMMYFSYLTRSRLITYSYAVLAFLVLVSRVVLGVHYLSDVLSGFLLGLLIASVLSGSLKDSPLVLSMWHKLSSLLELRRQIVHMVCGLGALVCLYLGVISAGFLFVLALVGVVLGSFATMYPQTLLSRAAQIFGRVDEAASFPGRGAVYMVLGVAITYQFFPERAALAGIAILTVGDAVATIVGSYFSRISLPWNAAKHFEAYLAGVVASTVVVAVFLPLPVAFLVSVVALLFETLPLRIGRFSFDDNLTLPIIGAATAWLLTYLIH